ncbi:MAG: hypothetical protein Ta2B_10090 [Termitinemataceae bacterium]|nr:MAG: hypothetical protein Ta2B_10090 [Termitinemataceae bacterium]
MKRSFFLWLKSHVESLCTPKRLCVVIAIGFFFLVAVYVPLPALDIDSTELGKSQGLVEFENNPNKVKGDTTIDQIRAIGKDIAKALRDKNGKLRYNVVVGDKSRYSIREVYDVHSTDDAGLSADIINIGNKAGVDTITNLRHILSGYIEEAYRYPRVVSDELAIYVTVYNALNRKKIERFSEFYKDAVVKNLHIDDLGLSSSYKDWPGSTQIVIPLYDPDADGNMQIELKEVVNKEVVEAVKKDPIKGANPEKFKPTPPPPTKEQQLAKARKATEKAENELKEFERALADAQNRAMLARRAKESLEDKLIKAQADLDKVSVAVVRNKFGEPIKGNEQAKAKETEVEQLKKSAAAQPGKIKIADDNVIEAERKLQEARERLEARKAEESQIG